MTQHSPFSLMLSWRLRALGISARQIHHWPRFTRRLPDFGSLTAAQKEVWGREIWEAGRDMHFWMRGFREVTTPRAGDTAAASVAGHGTHPSHSDGAMSEKP